MAWPLLVRCDAGTIMGAGHLMRCLALAQECLRHGGRPLFVTHCESDLLRERIRAEGMDCVPLRASHPDPSDLETTAGLLHDLRRTKSLDADIWTVLDGYHFDQSYQQSLQSNNTKLIVIDDMGHLPRYHCDLLLNQNFHAHQLDYQPDPHTVIAMGPKYVLLRSEFLHWRKWKREIMSNPRRILITMGSSDASNASLEAMKAVEGLGVSGLEVRVIAGPGNPHLTALNHAAASATCAVEILHNVSNVPELMAWADLAISSGGITVYELAFMGLPSLVIATSKAEALLERWVRQFGLFPSVEWSLDLSQELIAQKLNELWHYTSRRRQIAERARAVVDGLGAERIVAAILGNYKELLKGANGFG